MKTKLAEYDRKRNFKQTAEPAGRRQAKAAAGNSFVIQKHDATRLHFDFRLEMDGVLKSWAVPKGIPLEPDERHLAVEVEDHPLEYAGFEGTIPPGNYGAGTVMVWDRGTYELLGGTPLKAWHEGKLHFLLHGEKLKGEWTLVRTRRDGDKNQWLLLKTGGDVAELPKKTADRSVVSKRLLPEIARADGPQWVSGSGPAKLAETSTEPARPRPAARRRRIPLEYVAPMKPVLVAELPPDADEWLYEIKFDGFRMIALKDGDAVELWSSTHKPLKFPDIAAAIAKLPCEDAVLDGEIVALDSQGRSSFQLLQNSRAGQHSTPICVYLFDLLRLDGKDLKKQDTLARKAKLAKLVDRAPADERIRFSGALDGSPESILTAVRQHGLEGIVAKSRAATYRPGTRGPIWQKVKILAEQEFVIGGYTPPEGGRQYFGALLIGVYRAGKLEYVARVGTGFSHETLESCFHMFKPLQRATCPFANLPDKQSGRWGQGITVAKMKLCTWLKPTLVCQVRFAEWTSDGAVRHPVFLGLREDKPAREVRRETPVE